MITYYVFTFNFLRLKDLVKKQEEMKLKVKDQEYVGKRNVEKTSTKSDRHNTWLFHLVYISSPSSDMCPKYGRKLEFRIRMLNVFED